MPKNINILWIINIDYVKFNDNKFNFDLLKLLKLSDQDFRNEFSGSPIKRIGRDRFIRNCCIATGNSKNEKLVPSLINLLMNDKSSLVRGAAVWALQQIGNKQILNYCLGCKNKQTK